VTRSVERSQYATTPGGLRAPSALGLAFRGGSWDLCQRAGGIQ
jgi:hypothetical protein